MAFRHFQQFVPEFDAWTLANGVQSPLHNFTTAQEEADFLGARMFGRWKSGAPIDLAPLADNPALGADPERNNLFTYADTLLDETRCPFAAHTRKVNPRADLADAAVLMHAMRSSIPYGPELEDSEISSGTTELDRGLLFGTILLLVIPRRESLTHTS